MTFYIDKTMRDVSSTNERRLAFPVRPPKMLSAGTTINIRLGKHRQPLVDEMIEIDEGIFESFAGRNQFGNKASIFIEQASHKTSAKEFRLRLGCRLDGNQNAGLCHIASIITMGPVWSSPDHTGRSRHRIRLPFAA